MKADQEEEEEEEEEGRLKGNHDHDPVTLTLRSREGEIESRDIIIISLLPYNNIFLLRRQAITDSASAIQSSCLAFSPIVFCVWEEVPRHTYP